jgi:hypothetical protein
MDFAKRIAKLEGCMKKVRREPSSAACGYPAMTTAVEPFVVDRDLGEPCQQCGRERHRDGRPFHDFGPLIVVEGDGFGGRVGNGGE